MKTIATVAVLMMLSAPTWADEPVKNEANTNEPMVLSEADMDQVTAGYRTKLDVSFKIHGYDYSVSGESASFLAGGEFPIPVN